MKTTVVNKKNESYDIDICRPGIWGNPFSHLKNTSALFRVKNRTEAVEKHMEWIKEQPELMSKLHELKGKKLGCVCVDKNGNGLCHGKNLVKLIEELDFISKYKSIF